MGYPASDRKGVTLLLVVSIIVLFLLMGTTFMLVSNSYLSESRGRLRLKFRDERPQVAMQRAFYDLVRGPDLRNTQSPFRGTEILADMYGYGGFTGYVDSFAAHPQSTGGNLYEVQLRLNAVRADSELGLVHSIASPGTTQNLDTLSGGNQFFYNGMLFSLVSGTG